MKEVKKERLFTATVLSNKMDKTAVVLLERKVKHPKYKKYVTKSSKSVSYTHLRAHET